MKLFTYFGVSLAALLVNSALAEVAVVAERKTDGSGAFVFPNVARPARNDAGSKAKFSVVDGTIDPNSGGLAALNDGNVPSGEDVARRNFFFGTGTKGGRVLVDLGESISIKQVRSYSWHPAERGPQVYQLFGSLDSTEWKELAKVDSRPKSGDSGGQYAVSIGDTSGALGEFRYLRFDISSTEGGPFGNTFFSEIDVVGTNDPEEPDLSASEPVQKIFETQSGKYRFSFDLTAAPDLSEWTEGKLTPVVQEWYPKLVAMLPSEGFEAPTDITIRFREDMGGTPASAGGSRINCNVEWFRKNLQGEAAGSVVHEMVHVVQSYGRARRNDPNATRTPGWIVGGIPDYIRWFLYEPQIKGAEITRKNLERARYDASYRITGNFLNWVVGLHGQEVIPKLNAAAREGKYSEDLWKEYTGKTLTELGETWKNEHEKRLAEKAKE